MVRISLQMVDDSTGVQKIQLKVSGRGEDGRCRWCKSFRCGLISLAKERHQYLKVVRPCRFDTTQ